MTPNERAREFAKTVCDCDTCGGECMRHCIQFENIQNAYVVGFERAKVLAVDWLITHANDTTPSWSDGCDESKLIEGLINELEGEKL